jgi:hypothetical protein
MVLSLELLDLEEAAFFPTQPSSHERLVNLTTTERGEQEEEEEEEVVVGLKRCLCVENTVLTIPLFLALGSA